MWVRAVWLEGECEEEGVIPLTWILDGKVNWPPGVDASKAIREQAKPTTSWRKFVLKKIKISSENKTECELFDDTTTVETSDEDSNKRKRIQTCFTDYVTGKEYSGKSSAPVQGNAGSKKQKLLDELSLPIPPAKISRLESKPSSKSQDSYSVRSQDLSSSRSRSKSKESASSRSQSKESMHCRSQSNHRSSSKSKESPSSRSQSKESMHCRSLSKHKSRSKSKESASSRSQSENSVSCRSRSKHRSRSKSKESASRSRSKNSLPCRSQSKHRSRSKSRESASSQFENSLPFRSQSKHRSKSKSKESTLSSCKSKESLPCRSRSKSNESVSSESLFQDKTRLESKKRSPIPKSSSKHRSRSISQDSILHISRPKHRSRSYSKKSPESKSKDKSRSRSHRSRSVSHNSLHRSHPKHSSRTYYKDSVLSTSHSLTNSKYRSFSKSLSNASHSQYEKYPFSKSRSPSVSITSTDYRGRKHFRSRSRSRSPSWSMSPIRFSLSRSRSSSRSRLKTQNVKDSNYLSSTKSFSTHTEKAFKPKGDGFPIPEGRFQKRVFMLLNQIKDEITALKRNRRDVDVEQIESLFQMDSLNDLNEFESRIKVPEERQKMIQALSSIGGISVKDNVKKVMEKLMSNGLMAKFSMSGKRNKLGFKSTGVFRLVLDSAMRTKMKENLTEQEVVSAIQTCLKYAPDRQGGGGRSKSNL